MQSFDYIESEGLRKSLESDYREMLLCEESHCWKSAQVLAGSIVESLLVDYLLSSKPAGSSANKDPLKMTLAECIEACKQAGALSERSASLCAVIQSYRNLIHPARMVRLNEEHPNESSCKIAVSLINLIVEDIAKLRKSAVGLTAEQILSKINRDSQVLTILKHLLEDTRDHQRLRLVVELIPQAYLDIFFSFDSDDKTLPILSNAYQIAFNSLPDAPKTIAVDKFARMLKEDSGSVIETYRVAFLRASQFQFLSPQHLRLIKEHLFGVLAREVTMDELEVVMGIGPYLEPADAANWINPLVAVGVAPRSHPTALVKRVRDVASDAMYDTSPEVVAAVFARIDLSIRLNEARGRTEIVELLKGFRLEIDPEIPF